MLFHTFSIQRCHVISSLALRVLFDRLQTSCYKKWTSPSAPRSSGPTLRLWYGYVLLHSFFIGRVVAQCNVCIISCNHGHLQNGFSRRYKSYWQVANHDFFSYAAHRKYINICTNIFYINCLPLKVFVHEQEYICVISN